MKFQLNHDYHIHSFISPCSDDPEQVPDRIFKYALDNGLNEICLTDHHWDESVAADDIPGFYKESSFERISSALPLPQSDKVKFRFGCETELDKNMVLGIAPDHFDRFDFVIIPTTHMHMTGFTVAEKDYSSEERMSELWVERISRVLDMDLPFEKIGFAHLTCILMPSEYKLNEIKVLDSVPDDVLREIFATAAKKGAGIELNYDAISGDEDYRASSLRYYRIAKECGCKFYAGSDAHGTGDFLFHPYERTVNLLGLEETDRYFIPESK